MSRKFDELNPEILKNNFVAPGLIYVRKLKPGEVNPEERQNRPSSTFPNHGFPIS